MMIRFRHDRENFTVHAHIFPYTSDGADITHRTAPVASGTAALDNNDVLSIPPHLRAAAFRAFIPHLRRRAFDTAVRAIVHPYDTPMSRDVRIHAYAMYQEKFPRDWPHLDAIRRRRKLMRLLSRAAADQASRARARYLLSLFSIGSLELSVPLSPSSSVCFSTTISDIARYFDIAPQHLYDILLKRHHETHCLPR